MKILRWTDRWSGGSADNKACPSRAFMAAMVVLSSIVSQPAAFAQANEQAAMSLQQAIELALGNSPDLAAAAARLDAALADSQAAASSRWPRLNLEAGVQSTDNPVFVFSQKLLQEGFTEQDFALGRLNSPSMHEDFSARIVALQPLYAGGGIEHGIGAANQSAEGYEALAEASRQNVVRSITDIYTQAVVAEKRVEVAEQALATAQAHLELADSLFEGGLVVESDRLLAGVRKSEVEARLMRVRSGHRIATAALNLAIGRAADDALNLTLSFGFEPSIPEDVNSGLRQKIDRALRSRSDLLALRRFHDASLSSVEVARAGGRPKVGVEAAIETHDPDFFGTSGTNGSLMLGLRLPLFDGGENKAARLRAEAESRQAQAAIERLEDAVELDVRRAFFGLEVARQQEVLASQSLTLAARSLEIIEDRYRNGITTLVDLLDAQSAVTNSEVRVLDAKRDALLAQVALSFATGGL